MHQKKSGTLIAELVLSTLVVHGT
jgi:hypothetical protein